MQFQFAHLLPVVLAESRTRSRATPACSTRPRCWAASRCSRSSCSRGGSFADRSFALVGDARARVPHPAGLVLARLVFRDPVADPVVHRGVVAGHRRGVLPRWRLALVAGLFLGALEATRIDAIVFLIGVPVICAVAWLRSRSGRAPTRSPLPAIGAFVAGLVPGYALGLVDLDAPQREVLHRSSRTTCKLSLAIRVRRPWRDRRVCCGGSCCPCIRRLPGRCCRRVAAAGVVRLGFAAWAVRPRLQHRARRRGGRRRPPEGRARRRRRDTLYFERSLTWMSWYLGPLTLAVAIIGAATPRAGAVARPYDARPIGVLAVLRSRVAACISTRPRRCPITSGSRVASS